MAPWTVVESIFQGASDSVAENGWAYGAGKIAPDIVLAFVGAKGLDKLAKVDKLGDAGDAAKAASTLKNVQPVRGRPIQSVTAKIKPREIPRLAKKLTPEELSKIKKLKEGRVDNVSEAADAAKEEGRFNATKPFQEHHFATNKSKTYTQQLEEVTNKYGLDLDDAWNKDLMPHQGRHPNEYHEYTLDSMKQFDEIALGDKDVFLKLFDAWKENVRNNPDMLYKNYWE